MTVPSGTCRRDCPMACQLCDLGPKSYFQMMPMGSSTPDVYVVFDKPTEDELRFNDITKGTRGQYLFNSLASVGMTNWRAFSVIRCSCESGTPTAEETERCLRFVKSDIYRSNPKVIISVGGYTTQALLGVSDKITNTRGLVKKLDINGREFPVVPVYSPTYVLNKYGNSEIVGEFMNDLATASKIVTGEYLNPMDRNVLEYALDYETFRRFYEENLKGEEILAYDIETNAKLVFSKDFEICGWSLAKEGVGIYVCLESLEYSMSEEDRSRCVELLVQILRETPKIVVHNSLYERPATYYQYGYELPFEKVEDTLVMAKIMLGGKVGAGLKPNARRIGYPEWDADIQTYIENFCKAVKRCSLKKFRPIVESLREGKTFDQTFDELRDGAKYDPEIEGYYDAMRDVTARYYDESELGPIMALLSSTFVRGFDEGTTSIIPYTWVPKRVICRYGATDSLATIDLYHYFLKRFEEDSTDEVDLNKGYYYDLMEHNTGHELMMAGIHWDDKSAIRDYAVYSEMATKSLRAMLLCGHPAMDEQVAKAYRVQMGPKVIYDSYNDWFWENVHRRIEMKDDDTYVTVFLKDNGKEWRRPVRFFFEDLDIPESIREDMDSRIIDRAKEDIRTKDYTELKEVFNPGSTMPWVSAIYNEIVMDDDFRLGFFINKVRDGILQNEEVDRGKYSQNEQALIAAIENYLAIPAPDIETRRSYYEPIKSYVLSIVRMDSEDMQEFLGEMRDLRLDRMAEEFQLLAFDSIVSTPMDPDNPDTWTEPFKWNFFLRMYKKATKIITAYLEGSVGRQSVYEVDAETLRRGDDVVYRETPYFDVPEEDGIPEIPDGKDWLEQTNFGVGTAETGRWRSAIHVIPSSSTIKRLMTSRFIGGTIFQPDFSANELRCVASMANEENMLQAFRDGLDIHRANAARMFRVPIEEVTGFQRRWAKALSFMTLYGGNARTLAESYFNGDMVRAQKQLDSFYGAFPGLSKFIDAKRDEVMRTHKVSTLTQRFINVDFDPNDRQSVSKAMRAAVNYPVQSYHGSTGIMGLDGRVHTFEELVERGEDLWVYSYDRGSGRIVPSKGIRAQCTGETDTWYEIFLDNGKSLKVTPEHKMLLRNGTYRRADELTVGTSLMPLYLTRLPEDSPFEPNRLTFSDQYHLVQEWAHDEVYGFIPDTSVHHINIDPDDNRPDNLIRLSNTGHVAYHRNFYEYCRGTKTFDEFISAISYELWRNYGDRFGERVAHIREFAESLDDEARERFARQSMTSRNQRRGDDYPEWYENQRESARREAGRRLAETGNVMGMPKEDFSRSLRESWKRTRDYRSERIREGHRTPEARSHLSEAARRKNQDPDFIFKYCRNSLGWLLQNNLSWETPEDWDRSIEGYRSTAKRRSSYILKAMTWDSFLERAHEYAATYNHKVVDIRVHHLDSPEPKYDLHVPELHNFALECGVFSHNSSSSTMAAVVFCDILLYMKRHHFKSKGICFIHDSLESDVYPYELLEVIHYQQGKLEHGAVDYFGIQCKADMSMGYSMGHECEMPEIEFLDEGYTKANITLKGSMNDILDTVNNWKLAYHRVEILEEEWEDEYFPLSEMFISKKAFDADAMSNQKQGRAKIYVQYYNEAGEVEPMATDFSPINIWDGSNIYQYIRALD